MSGSNKATLLVTGVSGHLGHKAVEYLLEQGVEGVAAMTRTPEKASDLAEKGVEVRAGDFEDLDSLAAAFDGVERLLLVSSDAVGTPGQRFQQHKNALQAAEAAGVKHVVYTSFTNATADSAIILNGDHFQTETMLKAMGMSYTILRDSIYADSLLGSLVNSMGEGVWRSAAGTGNVNYVVRADCARAAAAVLASDRSDRATLDITGPGVLTHGQIAELVSEVTGKPLRHEPITLEQLEQGMVAADLPEGAAKTFASFDLAMAQGELDLVSHEVEKLTGHAPMSLREFLTENKAALLGE